MFHKVASNLKVLVSDHTCAVPAGLSSSFETDYKTSEGQSFYHAVSLNHSVVAQHYTLSGFCDTETLELL